MLVGLFPFNRARPFRLVLTQQARKPVHGIAHGLAAGHALSYGNGLDGGFETVLAARHLLCSQHVTILVEVVIGRALEQRNARQRIGWTIYKGQLI